MRLDASNSSLVCYERGIVAGYIGLKVRCVVLILRFGDLLLSLGWGQIANMVIDPIMLMEVVVRKAAIVPYCANEFLTSQCSIGS